MNQLPLVSIIIPVYNSEKYLKKCLDSVTDQSYGNIEIIAVNDGSADKSGIILEKYASKDKRIKVIHQENKGQSAARNKALDISEGEWIAFADSDDICYPRMIETLLKSAVKTGSDACWAGFILSDEVSGTTNHIHPMAGTYSGKNLLDWYYFLDSHAPYGLWCGIYKRKIFDELRFPEGRIFEDTYIFPRIIGSIKKCSCTETPVYHYFQRKSGTFYGSNMKKQMDILWVIKENIQYISDNFPDYSGHLYRKYFGECCNLLSKMEPSGLKYPEYRKPLINAFKETARNMTGGNLYHKGALFLFNISPALLAQCCRIEYSGKLYIMSLVGRISGKNKKATAGH